LSKWILNVENELLNLM